MERAMKNTIKTINLFFIAFFSSLCFGQIPGLINYNENDGLNCSYTYEIKQDSKGFIWIGSDNGLFRFDGKEFRQYGKKDGLKNIDILSCEPLPNGEIFIIPFLNDFACLKNNKVINSDTNKELKKIQFANNPVLIPNENELFFYDNPNPKNIFVFKDGKVKIIPLSISHSLSKLPASIVSFDFPNHLLYLSNEKGEIIVCNTISKKETICNIVIKKEEVFFEKNNFFFRKTGRRITIYTLENFHHFREIYSYEAKEELNRLIVDRNSNLWIRLTKGGVLYFDKPISEKKTAPVKLMENYVINDVLMDKDNNVWFTSKKNGVFFITNNFFRNYMNLPIKNNSCHITAITGNTKDIFMGYNESDGGIFHRNTIKNITFEKSGKAEHKAIYADDDIVIFGLSQNVFLYNLHNRKTLFLKDYYLKNIVPYTNSSVLFCILDGLTAYDFTKNNYSPILTNERIYSALPYAKDSLFVGNFKNLYKVNSKTKRKILFLEGYYFTDLKMVKPNLYIGATNLNGLILFNTDGIIKKITQKEGLATDQIKKVEVETENVFWASTTSGISRVELKGTTVKINTFTQTDGLPSNVVAGCVIRKDTIYIGTSKGLGVFSINTLLNQQKFINKKVIINSVVVGRKEYFNLNQELTGHTPDNDVVFNVSFPDYASQGKVSYKYKIDGLNSLWQTSNSSKIIFNSVPPGKYTFKVIGIGYNGKQSYVSTDLVFEIKPQFWQTWWFKLLLTVIIVAVVSMMINFYFQKKRNKKLETLYYEKKIAELELQAIKAQINPHFIYNCLNSIQFLLYKKDYQETENYLDTFSQMIRKTLHYSEKTFMPIKEEVEYLSLYLNMEKLRSKDQFDYKITVSEKVDKNWTIPSLLIQPFVENAIKHGVAALTDRKGCIEISFDYHDLQLSISIEDNGIGIGNTSEAVIKADSFGVKLSQKRIETFKQLFETNIILELNNLTEKQGTQIKLYISPYENKNTGLHH